MGYVRTMLSYLKLNKWVTQGYASFSKDELDAFLLACGSLLTEISSSAKTSLPTNTVLLQVEELKRNQKLQVCYTVCIYCTM